ncbi:sensor histidine kinase [Massilia solisilvae]|uniref:Sensor histidine kinase n=1 Tax=Massilia solisilvae TaxID=1811225 RepID=A0ABT2BPT1_9BURK|nr:sensor histidine kinase [Massilia solisilvae]MCS0610499.1 sensor histidine kinase [Massilia solisilvae]
MNTIQRILKGPWIPPEFGKMPYMWLFSLCFVWWKYLYVVPDRTEVLLIALTTLLFLPIYLHSFWVERERALLYVALASALATIWAFYNFSNLFIFAGAMCARVQPQRRAYQTLAAVMAVAVAAGLLLARERLFYFMPLLVVGLPVGIAAISEASLRRTRQALLRKQEEVEHLARIAERERISRDLHDLLGHSLSMIALKAELAGKLAERDVAACRSEIHDIETAARKALSEVRAAVTGYRQSGLASALASARASLAAANVELHEEVQRLALPPAKEHVLALALREAVTNVVRHAQANRCRLALAEEDGMAVLRVADDGARVREATDLKRGNGLTGMHERAAAAGGSLSITAGPGTTLELRLPLGEPA